MAHSTADNLQVALVLVSFVGVDAIHGVPRYTFGFNVLDDGISHIPVLIGLFGLVEVLRVLPKTTSTSIPANVGRVAPPMCASPAAFLAALELKNVVVGPMVLAVILGPVADEDFCRALVVLYTFYDGIFRRRT